MTVFPAFPVPLSNDVKGSRPQLKKGTGRDRARQEAHNIQRPLSSAARRFSRSDWDPPPPAWQGSRACGIQARLRQIELRGTPHLPQTPPSWPGPGPSSVAPNAVREPSSLRWPPKCRPGASDGLQIAKLCKWLQNSTKFSKLMLNSANLC